MESADDCGVATERRALRFQRWTSRPLPLFATIYILMIFGFASAYYCMPGHFHHPTVKYERSMISDRDAIQDGLRQAMIESYKQSYGGTTSLKAEEWTANVTDLMLQGFRYDSGRFVGTIKLPHDPELSRSDFNTFGSDGPSDPIFSIEMPYTVDEGGSIALLDPNDEPTIAVAVRSNQSDKPMERLISIKYPNGTVIKGSMKIPTTLYNRMLAHLAASEGFPGHASGSFWRMVYLSTVTITTLGYGDILPITELARALVAVEAIAGTLVIGLYISAVGNRQKAS